MKKVLTTSLLLVFIFIVTSPPSSAIAVSSYNSPLGITARNDNKAAFRSLENMENRLKLMVEAGVAWDRLFISYGYVYNPDDNLNRLDQILGLYRRYNIHPYFLLYNEATPTNPFNSPPENITKWKEYLTLLVNRYGNDVKHWEISFEQNAPNTIFGQQPQLYVQFLEDSATTIRQLDPQAKIILGRLLPSHIRYLDSLLQENAASYFDIISLGGPYQCDRYDEAEQRIDAVKNILSRYGINKPIWLTEALCVSDHNLDGVNDDIGYEDQKTYIKEVYKRALTAGAEKIFYQSFVDRNDFPIVGKRMSGIMSIDNSFVLHKKPSFAAYQQAARDAGFPPLTPTPTPLPLAGDIDPAGGDGDVDIFDFSQMLTDFGKTGTAGFIPADIDKNGKVDIFDHNILVGNFGKRQ